MKRVTIGLCVATVLAIGALPAFATDIPNRMMEWVGHYGIGSADNTMVQTNWAGAGGKMVFSTPTDGWDVIEVKKYNDVRGTLDLTTSLPTYNYDYDAGAAVPSVPCGGGFNGTDDDPLVVMMYVDDINLTGYQSSNLFVEMSMDSDFTPEAPNTIGAHSSLAFGQYTSWGGSSAAKYFDGVDWVDTKYTGTSMWSSKRGNTFTMTIKTNTVELELNSKNAGITTNTFPRQYLGAFNQISISQYVAGLKPMEVEQVKITGGVIVPEPATMALLSIGLLPLLRRRRRR
jgi:hypothetical protein